MRITIVGSAGQLGCALQRVLVDDELQLLDLPDYDITAYPDSMEPLLSFRPRVVINCAAMTNVDGCESDPDLAFRVNALGARNVALACQAIDAAMVQVSTDYVFDGTDETPRYEYDQPNPESVYARSKLAGERIVRDLLPCHYIVRTAWLYDATHRNFVTTMRRLAEDRPSLKVVTNEVGSPTYAADLAEAIAKLIRVPAYGIYHLVNQGICSRFDLARKALDLMGRADYPLEPTDHYPRPAKVPAHVELANVMGAAVGIVLRPWENALEECLTRGE
jgi:dTDP-4-dehydrorhamnose reductase